MAWSGSRVWGKKLNDRQPVWQEGIGSLLLLGAAQQTGLLDVLARAVREGADPTIPGLNPTVVERLLLTLLFLPVAGLARTWDLRGYTGTMLALLTSRERAYSQRYTERFLARLAHTGAAERLTEGVAKWTWELWQTEQPASDQPKAPAVFYVDGHRKAVYSDVLVPRGPVGKLGGKILGCRELVVLHDAQGHPLLATTHRGDCHLTIGLPEMLRCYEQATDLPLLMQRIVVDREGMAAELLAHLTLEGRQIVTLLKADQYKDEQSFEQVGDWQPWRFNRHGQMICEVAAARFALKRPEDAPALEVQVALIRDWRKLDGAAGGGKTTEIQDWQADLTSQHQRFWEEGWQALPVPPAPTAPKLIPVIATRPGMQAVELAHTYFRRWNCQENAIRDWLIPLNLDTNHGYAKEQVVNSELAKRQTVVQGRVQRLEQLAQARRTRLTDLQKQDQHLQEQAHTYEQQWRELSLQVSALEATGQTEQREYFPLKARQLAADWKIRQYKAKLDKNAMRCQDILSKCEGYCQELRQVLRRQEDLEAQARAMYELDHAKDQIMTLFKVALANLGMWVREQYFGAS